MHAAGPGEGQCRRLAALESVPLWEFLTEIWAIQAMCGKKAFVNPKGIASFSPWVVQLFSITLAGEWRLYQKELM
jgi:hypothetical protein